MEASPRLRKVKSLKSSLSAKARRDSVLDEEETLPSRSAAKPTLLQFHVTADDIGLKPMTVRPPPSSLKIPSPRNTWPETLRETRPGTYAFNETPTLVKTPWEQNRALRSGPRRSRSTRRNSMSSQLSARLPREILHCILDHLEASRKEVSRLDVLGCRADLRSLTITNKQWHRVAREHLYRDIWLPWRVTIGQGRSSLPVISSRSRTSLTLLLRTLQGAPGLAHLVKRLHIPHSMISKFDVEIYLEAQRSRNPSFNDVIATICEIIRQCPNLRCLSGHHVLACDQTTGLLNALASRPKLQEHVWNLPRCVSDWQKLAKPGSFVNYHAHWRQLETLAISGHGLYSSCLGPGTITAVMQRLPSLKHLMLKGLSKFEFHNGTLLMLPALKSLRLEDVHGITDHGLQQLINSRLAMSLEHLSLIELELTSLQTVRALLDHLPQLKRFRLVQDTSPELQEVFSFTGTSFSLGSPTLEYLHWNDMLCGHATPILANAIAAGKFPKLHTVKIPSDHYGAVQRVCRPIQQRRLTEREIVEHVEPSRRSEPKELRYRKTTQFLETEAQLRAKGAREDSAFSVTVEDEEGVERFQWSGSYLGSIASKIRYSLEADVDGQYVAHARVEDLSRPAKLEEGWEQIVGLDVLF